MSIKILVILPQEVFVSWTPKECSKRNLTFVAWDVLSPMYDSGEERSYV